MADVLEQSEVEAILAAADSGTIPEAQRPSPVFGRKHEADAPVELKQYDFKRPERVSKDQMRALQTLHEAFARNFGASLSGFLRTIVEVRVATCEQMTYSEFISGLPNPTSFNLLRADGLEGQMCMEISPLIIYPIIDRLLGGNSSDLFIPQRPMTIIETRLISNITNRGLTTLSEAWSSFRALQFTIAATESNPQHVQYNVIEPLMEVLSTQSWFSAARSQHSPELEKQIGQSLSRAGLSVTGLLAETTITLRDLVEMSPGDVIITEKPASSPVVVCVEGRKKYLAHVGQYRNSRALKILRAMEPGDRA
jgi:flagellar motor switch protein FliM